jgi:hypothetical protein
MEKSLTVYPISTGNELSIFANDMFKSIKIMDMDGNVLHTTVNISSLQETIDIEHLPNATYIIEILYENNRTGRSVFVKI